jgi:hypothetical protein
MFKRKTLIDLIKRVQFDPNGDFNEHKELAETVTDMQGVFDQGVDLQKQIDKLNELIDHAQGLQDEIDLYETVLAWQEEVEGLEYKLDTVREKFAHYLLEYKFIVEGFSEPKNRFNYQVNYGKGDIKP